MICFPLAFVCSLTISGFLDTIPVFTYPKLLLPTFLAFHQTAIKPFHWSSKIGIRKCPQKSLIPRPIPSLSTHPTDSKKPFPCWPATLHHSPLWMFAVWLWAAPKASFQCFLHRSAMSGCLPLILLCVLLHRTTANLPCWQLPIRQKFADKVLPNTTADQLKALWQEQQSHVGEGSTGDFQRWTDWLAADVWTMARHFSEACTKTTDSQRDGIPKREKPVPEQLHPIVVHKPHCGCAGCKLATENGAAAGGGKGKKKSDSLHY